MDLNQYLRLVAATQKANPSWRYGQTLFNVLQAARPDLGEAIVGTDVDPFHDDSRDAEFRDVTTEWLNRYFGPMSWRELHMRPQGVKRRDDAVKLELFDEYVRSRYCITAAWDDRDRVVAAYRGIGLPVFQVNYGAF